MVEYTPFFEHCKQSSYKTVYFKPGNIGPFRYYLNVFVFKFIIVSKFLIIPFTPGIEESCFQFQLGRWGYCMDKLKMGLSIIVHLLGILIIVVGSA